MAVAGQVVVARVATGRSLYRPIAVHDGLVIRLCWRRFRKTKVSESAESDSPAGVCVLRLHIEPDRLITSSI